jgi:SET domain-containing protein
VSPAELRVGPSPIAGRGTFAAQPIPAGSVAVILDDPAALGALNHSCDPNLGWTDERTLHAVRDIPLDAELTLDYGTCIDDPAVVMMCHCETYRCRQVIEGTDWQIPQLQRRYAGQFAPAVQRRIDATSGGSG